MSGICDKCKRKPCPAEGEGLRYCDFYEGGETRYERLFGTPERGTCNITRDFKCGACGHQYPKRNCEAYTTEDGSQALKSLDRWVLACDKPNYCPNCGAKAEPDGYCAWGEKLVSGRDGRDE